MRGITGGPWKGRKRLRKKYPLAFPLSESQLEILDGVARYGPINPNKLRKKVRKAYSFVFNTLKNFEMRKMVTLRREKNEKGSYSKIYDLALEGILLILYRRMRTDKAIEKNSFSIRKVIDTYSSFLPLVFGKWKYFEDLGLESLLLTRLKITVDTYNRNPFERGTGFYPWLEKEPQIVRFFYLFDFYRLEDHFITNFDPKKWINALKHDEDLKTYMIQELKNDQKGLKNRQKWVETIIRFIEKPNEKE